MADDEDVTLEGKPISELRVVDLKKELDQRGLSKAGSKVQLTERLRAQLLLEKKHNEESDSSTVDAKAPNLALQDDEVTGQNDFIKHYLAQQQRNLEQQMQFKKKIHELERHSAGSTDDSTEEEVMSSDKVKVATNAPAASGSGDSDMAKSRKYRHGSKEDKKESVQKENDKELSGKGDAELKETERKSTRHKRPTSPGGPMSRERYRSGSSSRSGSRTPERSRKKKSKSRRDRKKSGKKEFRSSSRSPSPVLHDKKHKHGAKQSTSKSPSPEFLPANQQSSKRTPNQSTKSSEEVDLASSDATRSKEARKEESRGKNLTISEPNQSEEGAGIRTKKPLISSSPAEPGVGESKDKISTAEHECKPAEGSQSSELAETEQKPIKSSRWRRSRSGSKPSELMPEEAFQPEKGGVAVEKSTVKGSGFRDKHHRSLKKNTEVLELNRDSAETDKRSQKVADNILSAVEKSSEKEDTKDQKRELGFEKKAEASSIEKDFGVEKSRATDEKTSKRENRLGSTEEKTEGERTKMAETLEETERKKDTTEEQKIVSKEFKSGKQGNITTEKPSSQIVEDISKRKSSEPKDDKSVEETTSAKGATTKIDSHEKKSESSDDTLIEKQAEIQAGKGDKNKKELEHESKTQETEPNTDRRKFFGEKREVSKAETKREGKGDTILDRKETEFKSATSLVDKDTVEVTVTSVRSAKRSWGNKSKADSAATKSDIIADNPETVTNTDVSEPVKKNKKEEQAECTEKNTERSDLHGKVEESKSCEKKPEDSQSYRVLDISKDISDKISERTDKKSVEKNRAVSDMKIQSKGNAVKTKEIASQRKDDDVGSDSNSSEEKNGDRENADSKEETETLPSKRGRLRSSSGSSSSSSDSRSGTSSSTSRSRSSSSSDTHGHKSRVHGSVQRKKSRSPMLEERNTSKGAASGVKEGKSKSRSPSSHKKLPTTGAAAEPSRLTSMSDEKEESGKSVAISKSERQKDKNDPRPFRRLGSSNKAGSGDATISDEATPKDDVEPTLQEKPIRRRKWGSSRSTSNKRTSLEISTDSLKGLIDDVRLPAEPILDLEPGETMYLDSEEQQQQEKRDMKIKRTVVMREGEEMVEDTRHVESSEDIWVARKKRDSDSENEPPSKPKSKKKKIVKKDPDAIKKVLEETIEEKPKAEELPKIHRSISQPLVLVDEPEVAKREQSPARKPVSRIIHIINLVRPFTLGQLKQLLGRTGTLVDSGFWINSIKSHCYATFEKEEQAVATRKALHGARWPQSNPKTLRVDYADKDEMDRRRAEEEGGPPPPRPPPVSERKEPSPPPAKERRTSALEPDKKREERPVREWDRGKRSRSPERGVAARGRSRSRERVRDKERERERERRHRDQERSKERKEKKQTEAPKMEEEPPAKLLDDLFRKTKATPSIYWLPLTEEQYKQRQQEKLAARKKMREDQEAEQEAARKKLAESHRRDSPSPLRDRGGDRDRQRDRENDNRGPRDRDRDRPNQRDRDRNRDEDRDRRKGGRSGSRDRSGRTERSRSRDRKRR